MTTPDERDAPGDGNEHITGRSVSPSNPEKRLSHPGATMATPQT